MSRWSPPAWWVQLQQPPWPGRSGPRSNTVWSAAPPSPSSKLTSSVQVRPVSRDIWEIVQNSFWPNLSFCKETSLLIKYGWILAKPFPSVNWKIFLAPGIYADQQTGCQVFHFCQDGGRMDSFFCPNLTLFNQRFFVCDWWANCSQSRAMSVSPVCFRSYNVDCDSAHLHFSLNDRLYESQSAETISNAINQPVGLAQVGLSLYWWWPLCPVNLAMNGF